MTHACRLHCAAVALILAALCGGCSKTETGGDASAPDKSSWRLTLDMDGSEFSWPVEMMNIFWTDVEEEDYESYPDILEIHGAGVSLVGHLPKAWDPCGSDDENIKEGEPLVGRTIDIMAAFPEEERYHFLQAGGESFLDVPDKGRWRVTGGTFAPEKHTGDRMGSDGDYTLTGSVSLFAETPDGVRAFHGTLSAHCNCWY